MIARGPKLFQRYRLSSKPRRSTHRRLTELFIFRFLLLRETDFKN